MSAFTSKDERDAREGTAAIVLEEHVAAEPIAHPAEPIPHSAEPIRHPEPGEIERMTQRRAPLPSYSPNSEAGHIYAALWREIQVRMHWKR